MSVKLDIIKSAVRNIIAAARIRDRQMKSDRKKLNKAMAVSLKALENIFLSLNLYGLNHRM